MSNASNFYKRKIESLKFPRGENRPTIVCNDKNILIKDRNMLARLGYFVGREIDSGTFATVRYAEKTSANGKVALAVKVSTVSCLILRLVRGSSIFSYRRSSTFFLQIFDCEVLD